MRASGNIVISSGHNQPTVTKLAKPWYGRSYRCEGYGLDPSHYSNAYGDSPQQAYSNWLNKQLEEKALIKAQNKEAKIKRVW